MDIKNTSGFSSLLVVVSLVLIGVLGLMIWRISESKAERYHQQDSGAQSGQPEPPDQLAADPNEGYVVIKDWNVRFKPVQGLSGVQYFRPSDASGDLLTFTTEKLAQQAPGCASTSKNFVLGSLHRSKERGLPGKELGPINDYYFYLLGPQAACSDDPNVLEGPIIKMLFESIPTLEAAK